MPNLRHDPTYRPQPSPTTTDIIDTGTPDSARRSVRRRFLAAAAAAVPVAVASAAVAQPPAHAAPQTTPAGLRTTSLADLRALTQSAPGDCYWLTDPGRGGVFRYAPDDSDTADNGGTVVVTASGHRFHRESSGALNVRWFGAVGDGVTDDADAIQAAVDEGQRSSRAVHLPAGPNPYAIGRPITLAAAKHGIRIFGDFQSYPSSSGSVLTPTDNITEEEPLKAAFLFDDATGARFFEFSDLGVNGNKAMHYGIHGTQVVYSTFRRLNLQGTRIGGLGLGYGWGLTIDGCAFLYNLGDGFRATRGQLNGLNIVNCNFTHNDGIGINLRESGLGVRITGCIFEDQAIAAIHVQQDIQPLDISNNYFETNAAVGFKFDQPDRLVKADVVISGTGIRNAVGSEWPTGPVRMASNYLLVGESEGFVACYCASNGIEISGTTVLRGKPGPAYPLMITGTSRTGLGAMVERPVMHSNGVFPPQRKNIELVPIVVQDLERAVTDLHHADIAGRHHTNYAESFVRFRNLTEGTSGGELRRTNRQHRRAVVAELSGAVDTDAFGVVIDVATCPELAGRLVYFACTVAASDDATAAVLWSSALGDGDGGIGRGADWHVVSMVVQIPETGRVAFGVRKRGGSASSVVRISHPVIAEVGAPYERVPHAG